MFHSGPVAAVQLAMPQPIFAVIAEFQCGTAVAMAQSEQIPFEIAVRPFDGRSVAPVQLAVAEPLPGAVRLFYSGSVIAMPFAVAVPFPASVKSFNSGATVAVKPTVAPPAARAFGIHNWSHGFLLFLIHDMLRPKQPASIIGCGRSLEEVVRRKSGGAGLQGWFNRRRLNLGEGWVKPLHAA
jgi:hypothetical protein